MRLIWKANSTSWQEKLEMLIVHLLYIADAMVYICSLTLLTSAFAAAYLFRNGD